MAALSSLDEALIGVRAEKLDQLCSRDDLNEISKSLTHWPEVSPFLGLTEADEEDVRAKSDRAVSGLTRERVDVLRRWQENQKEGATYRWVVDRHITCRLSLPDILGPEPHKTSCQLIILLVDCGMYPATLALIGLRLVPRNKPCRKSII